MRTLNIESRGVLIQSIMEKADDGEAMEREDHLKGET